MKAEYVEKQREYEEKKARAKALRCRGHRKACKKIRSERAAEAPTPPSSPPREVFYGPAPRSHADEIRARIGVVIAAAFLSAPTFAV
ncbi:hypothetical protein JL722_11356 [Aureococcus anophagefferens]|nr:hypothetical protein JL722_11356 [Aureococcus anophagefferens]